MRVDCLTSDEAFDLLEPEWEALVPRTATNTLFLRPFWHRAWWHAYGAGKELRLLAVREADGQLVGVAPLFRHEMTVPQEGDLLPKLSIERPASPEDGRRVRFIHPIGGTEVSDYLDLVVAQEKAPAVYEALFAFLAESEPWDILDLHCLPAHSPTLKELPAVAEARGYRVAVAQEEVCPIVELPADWESYLAKLDKKDRHELRRKIRRTESEKRVSWRKTESAETLSADLQLFFRLHERSDEDKAAFWDDRTRLFFREIAESLLQDGLLELSFLYLDEEPVGSLFCFTYQGDYMVYNSGYEPRSYRYSPGLILFSYVIQDAIARGLKRFDFLRGNERYKYDLGGVDAPIYRLAIGRP